MSVPSSKAHRQPIYLVNFEAYLRPKLPHKVTPLQCFEGPPKPKSRWENFQKTLQRLKLLRYWRTLHAGCSRRLHQLPLPKFLSFLRARQDDGLCKTKTGFEIYCEMSSIHGFHIFVGARTWQRVLWLLLICTAVLLSHLVLIMSFSQSAKTPTILYIESLEQPISEEPRAFPGLTICSLNRVSQRKIKAMRPTLSVQSLSWLNTFNGRLPAQSGNVSWYDLLEQVSPRICESQVLGCQWLARQQNCDQLLSTSWSYSEGRCCSFRQYQVPSGGNPTKGLTLRLAVDVEDYASPRFAAAGFQLLLHEPHTGVHAATQRVFLPSGSEAHIMLKSYWTHGTPYLSDLKTARRGCYLHHERALFYFSTYSQDNCLAECRSEKIYNSCGCVHAHMPRRANWPLCDFGQLKCVQEQTYSWAELQNSCSCLPPCEFKRYELHSDLARLADNNDFVQSQNNESFFKNFNASNEVLLHIFFDSLSEERLLLDVYENWFTFTGTFGGITGLFMGCSFVSVFELIFFVCVRPTCNWLTRQQIQYRRRRQLKQQKLKEQRSTGVN